MESAEGRGLTREIGQAVGCEDLSRLNAMLVRMQRQGLITRDVRGRRTYRIALADAGGQPRSNVRRRANRVAPAADAVEDVEEELSHPRSHLRAMALLSLAEGPGHGYELIERLRPFGYDRDDAARIYRVLRWLDDAGLAEATWNAPDSGPARRVYAVTSEGRRVAKRLAARIRQRNKTLEGQLSPRPGTPLGQAEGARSFEVLVEAKIRVHAADEASARRAAEEALEPARAHDGGAGITGQVWLYDAVESNRTIRNGNRRSRGGLNKRRYLDPCLLDPHSTLPKS
jgi:DNA-binding PadR family transcriptional regulator